MKEIIIRTKSNVYYNINLVKSALYIFNNTHKITIDTFEVTSCKWHIDIRDHWFKH